VCGKKIGPDPRNFNQRVSLGRNDLLIRTFPRITGRPWWGGYNFRYRGAGVVIAGIR
ncbi:EAL domain-containing protein, partial [Enterobacter hormaechei subsp. xiangfangensis]